MWQITHKIQVSHASVRLWHEVRLRFVFQYTNVMMVRLTTLKRKVVSSLKTKRAVKFTSCIGSCKQMPNESRFDLSVGYRDCINCNLYGFTVKRRPKSRRNFQFSTYAIGGLHELRCNHSLILLHYHRIREFGLHFFLFTNTPIF